VTHTKGSLVLVKPTKGSIEPVFFAQLTEHVIKVTAISTKKRTRGRPPALVSRFTNDKPGVRYFSVSTRRESIAGVAYDYDPVTYENVNVAAIYGTIASSAYMITSVSQGGLLEAFDIQQDEIDRLEAILNEEPEQVENTPGSDSEEEESEALARSRAAHLKSKRFVPDNDPSLIVTGTRSRKPTNTLMDELRYREITGRDLSKHV
jgi:hypothetical protein